MRRLLIAMASLVSEHSLLGTWALVLWRMGLVVLEHVESSQIRDRTGDLGIGRWILFFFSVFINVYFIIGG